MAYTYNYQRRIALSSRPSRIARGRFSGKFSLIRGQQMGKPPKLHFLLILLGIALSGTYCVGVVSGGEAGLQRSSETPAEMPSGVVAGKVTDSITGAGIAYVAVTFEPAVDETRLSTDLHPVLNKASFSTDATGFYYAKIPIGPYRLTFSQVRYRRSEQNVV